MDRHTNNFTSVYSFVLQQKEKRGPDSQDPLDPPMQLAIATMLLFLIMIIVLYDAVASEGLGAGTS